MFLNYNSLASQAIPEDTEHKSSSKYDCLLDLKLLPQKDYGTKCLDRRMRYFHQTK